MTSIFILSLIGGTSLFIMGLLLRKNGKKSADGKIHGYGTIATYLGLYLLIFGSAYKFLHKDAWTDDNRQLFLFILIGSALLFCILFGLGFLRYASKSGSKIAFSSAIIYSVASILVSFIGFSKVSSMNDGWTQEKEKRFLDRCKSEDKYDCDCKLDIVKANYPNPEDYNAIVDNEANNAKAVSTLNDKFNTACMKCDSIKIQRETEQVGEGEGGLPADF